VPVLRRQLVFILATDTSKMNATLVVDADRHVIGYPHVPNFFNPRRHGVLILSRLTVPALFPAILPAVQLGDSLPDRRQECPSNVRRAIPVLAQQSRDIAEKGRVNGGQDPRLFGGERERGLTIPRGS
jgi:hypothetical protein